MCLKVPITDSSTLSLRIAQTLRPLGIIRSMRSYSIIADCLRLIWEQEDRLEAVQKEVYEPIADKQCVTGRPFKHYPACAQTAWHTNPSRVQELAGYPLDGCPSAVQFLEMLYNDLARG